MRPTLAALAFAALLAPAGRAAAQDLVPPETILAHRAVYEFSLLQSRDAIGMRAIQGRLVYEFRIKDCKTYALSYRQAMRMEASEGESSLLDFQSTAEEPFDSSRLEFDTSSTLNGKEDVRIIGRATKSAEGQVSVTLDRPEKRTRRLPEKALFPTEHLRKVLGAAKAGLPMFSADVFDGGEPGDVASPTLTTIGADKPASADGLAPFEIEAGLDKVPKRQMTISYFEDAPKEGGEQVPKFAFGAEVFDNGISRDLRLDYGSFTVSGKMVALEILPVAESCR